MFGAREGDGMTHHRYAGAQKYRRRSVLFGAPPLRRQKKSRQLILGSIFGDRLCEPVQRVGPELHAVEIAAQDLDGLPQFFPRRFGCCHDALRALYQPMPAEGRGRPHSHGE
jgi:hypothetical protein